MKSLTACLLVVCLGVPLVAGDRPIPRDKKIFIEKMSGDLDGYIRAEFTKQHVPLKLVLTEEDADLIMTGGEENRKRSWHEGWLSMDKDHATGNISIVDPKEKTILWSGEAGDRSLMWGAMARGGPRKVAARIVDKMKDAIAK